MKCATRQNGGMPAPVHVSFTAAASGTWRIDRLDTVSGDGLLPAARLAVIEGDELVSSDAAAAWTLRGVTSNTRYTKRSEVEALAGVQEGLGRPTATLAALIPIRKSPAWWALAQDERRAIIEEESRHIAIGFEYLPAIARRLHHCRDLGEPFDFLTWFEYPAESAPDFEALVRRLRDTREWHYVEREIDIRLVRS
ncbi:chlorite dismutase family protein [soil metagenome]